LRFLGTHDVALVTIDTLRYDVAKDLFDRGRTPNLRRVIPSGWEERHAPGTFTYASHAAFFAGFLPTPARPGGARRERLFALAFEGSETTGPNTIVFDAPDIVHGFQSAGYRTICIGGVGFFNKQNPLGRVLPSLFEESHWDRSFGVTDPHSTENQIARAIDLIGDERRRVFLFLNVSALHQPNRFYKTGAEEDSIETHAAALEYVDRALPPLLDAFARRGRTLLVLTSDHGTAYGEDGYFGHRAAHPVVWTVPYAEAEL
jgi:arylsulfatase A-like enzyme